MNLKWAYIIIICIYLLFNIKFFAKKDRFVSKKLTTINKRYNNNTESIQQFIEINLNIDKSLKSLDINNNEEKIKENYMAYQNMIWNMFIAWKIIV